MSNDDFTPTDEQIAALANALGAHEHSYDSDCGEDFGCGCGAVDDYDRADIDHSDHLAQTLPTLPAFQAIIRAAQAQALREVADAWHAKHSGTRPTAYNWMWDHAARIEADLDEGAS